MATVSIKHNTFYKDKNNKSPVVYVIRNKGTHTHINTGIKLDTKFWDDKKWVKKGAPGIIDHLYENTKLQKNLGEIQGFLTELTYSGENEIFSAPQIKEKFLNKQIREKYDFNTFFQYVISTKSKSTSKIYQHTYDTIIKFHPSVLSFSDVNARFLREFESWYKNSVNGAGIHLRNIRNVFNMAIDDEVINLSIYPFRRFKIKMEETKKRNLNIEDLRLFMTVQLSGVPGIARDLFMLQFYLIGINLKDLCYLPKTALLNGSIDYIRLKTKKRYYLKMEPEAQQLIKKLAGKKYLINIAEHYENYDSIKKEINKKLKVAASSAGIKHKISTYWSRHSWATVAHNLNIPEETIALSLGHASAHKTTSIYIERNMDKIAIANRKVINLLNYGPFQKVH